MLSATLLLLVLAVPPAPAGPAPAPAATVATTRSLSSDLRPVAGIDHPRTSTASVTAIASDTPELREPFAKTRAPVVHGPRAVAPRPAAAAAPAKTAPRASANASALRDPW